MPTPSPARVAALSGRRLWPDVSSHSTATICGRSTEDNFVITHELLNEMIGNRYPQTAEVRILREYIKTESHQLSVEQMRPPTAVTNAVSWRSEGIKHKKNDIFLDVVERLNLLVSIECDAPQAALRPHEHGTGDCDAPHVYSVADGLGEPPQDGGSLCHSRPYLSSITDGHKELRRP